jgi:hypothetical protein
MKLLSLQVITIAQVEKINLKTKMQKIRYNIYVFLIYKYYCRWREATLFNLHENCGCIQQNKLQRQLETVHAEYVGKTLEFFHRKL